MKLFILLLALAGTCFAFRHSHHHKLSSESECKAAEKCPASPKLSDYTDLNVNDLNIGLADPEIYYIFSVGWNHVIHQAAGDIPNTSYNYEIKEAGVQTIRDWTYYRFTVTLTGTSWTLTVAFVVLYNTKTGEVSVALGESGEWVIDKESSLVTQTGILEPFIGGAWDGATTDRTYTVHVAFPQAFSEVPSVAVNLVGFDNAVGYWNFDISPQAITTTGFDILVNLYAPSNNIYSFQPSYIATISRYSGIYFAQHAISNWDADVAAISTTPGDDRAVTRQLDIDLTGKKAMAFLRGMGFGAGNPALQVVISGNTIQYNTWDNVVLLRAASTIVYWDAAKRDAFTLDIGIAPDQLYPGFDWRTATVPISTGGLRSPQVWAGLWKLYYSGSFNDRLQTHIDPALTYVNITTWFDSACHDIQEHLFMTCQDKNARCLIQ